MILVLICFSRSLISIAISSPSLLICSYRFVSCFVKCVNSWWNIFLISFLFILNLAISLENSSVLDFSCLNSESSDLILSSRYFLIESYSSSQFSWNFCYNWQIFMRELILSTFTLLSYSSLSIFKVIWFICNDNNFTTSVSLFWSEFNEDCDKLGIWNGC